MRQLAVLAVDRLVTASGCAPQRGGSPRTILQIAGIRFTSRDRAAVFPAPLHYASFLGESSCGGGVAEIAVRTAVTPHPSAAARDLFRAEGAWSIGRTDGDYLLALDPAGPGSPPLASVRFTPAVEAVTLCAPETPLRHLVYPVDQIVMMYALARRGGIMLHAAGVGIQGRGYAFCGRSRAGKTTLARQIAGAAGFVPLSDDRVVVRGAPGVHALHGTPWPGEGNVAENRSFPLSGLVFLARGTGHRLERLSTAEALERLLPVAAVPWFDPEPLAALLEYCGSVVESVPCWELAFFPDPTVADFLVERLA